MRRSSLTAILLIATAAALFAGCGAGVDGTAPGPNDPAAPGGGSMDLPDGTPPADVPAVEPPADPGAAPGGLTFTVEFPDASARMIPAATQSVKVVVQNASTRVVLAQVVLTPSSPTTTVSGLNAGLVVTNTATAQPNADGSGTPMARAVSNVTIRANVNTPVTMTMRTTIARIDMTPTPAVLPLGSTLQLVATAKDAAGNIVLTSSTWTWASSIPASLPVSSTGLVSALAVAQASITATETESGKYVRATVGVAALDVTPTSLDFGASAFLKTLSVRNSGKGTLPWTVSVDRPWLMASPVSGQNAATVSIAVNRSGLDLGDYTGSVTVASSCGTIVVPVAMTVAPGGVPTSGRAVAWSGIRSGRRQILVAPSDGSAPAVNVSNNAYQNTVPSISADGSIVAWTATNDTSGDIWVAASNGSTPPVRITTSAGADNAPSLSGDGTKVAWAGRRDGNSEIYVADTSGTETNVIRITNNTKDDAAPALNYDGSKVVWVSYRDNNYEIYAADTSGTETNVVRVTNSTAIDNDPSISSDGSKVAWVGLRTGTKQIFVASTAGTEQSVVQVTRTGANTEPSLSGDGAVVAFSSTRLLPSEVYVADTSATESSILNVSRSTPATDGQPSISRDGRFVAFRTNRTANQEVYVFSLDTFALTNVSGNTAEDSTPSAS
jgi:TolB protein